MPWMTYTCGCDGPAWKVGMARYADDDADGEGDVELDLSDDVRYTDEAKVDVALAELQRLCEKLNRKD